MYSMTWTPIAKWQEMETQMKAKHANVVEIFIARLTTAYSRQNGLQVLKLMMGKMLFKGFTGNIKHIKHLTFQTTLRATTIRSHHGLYLDNNDHYINYNYFYNALDDIYYTIYDEYFNVYDNDNNYII